MSKNFPIPGSFDLHGHTILVRLDPKLTQEDDALGQALYRRNEIKLQTPSETWPFPPSKMEHSFFHELVHFILFEMNSPLRTDEVFVDNFASLLHQAMITSEGEPK